MNAPYFKMGLFGDEFSLIVAFIIGIGFGFFLERAGFGSARKLAAQFYFTDLSVLKVMFTAIITAMVGVYFLSRFGIMDLSLVYLTPTFLVPQVVGGLILGIGFVIGGYCPGTSCVSAATGRIDGMVYLGGILAGLIGFAELYPSMEKWVHTTSMGQTTLPKFFGISYGVLVFGVVLMALGAFMAAEWAERKFGGKTPDPNGSLIGVPFKLNTVRILAAVLAVLGLGAAFGGSPYRGSKVTMDASELAQMVGNKADHITPADLADWIIQGKSDYLLIDIREPNEFASYHIPTAINVPLASMNEEVAPRNEKIILYSEGGTHAAQAWILLKAQGYKSVYALLGGLDDWKDNVLFPRKIENATPEQTREFEKRVQVAKHFGGSAQGAREAVKTDTLSIPKMEIPGTPADSAAPKAKKKKEGC